MSSPEPVEGVDAPTIVESGLDVALSNWRGVVPARVRRKISSLLWTIDQMVNSEEWAAKLDATAGQLLQDGDAFAEFLVEQAEQTEVILTEIGLA